MSPEHLAQYLAQFKVNKHQLLSLLFLLLLLLLTLPLLLTIHTCVDTQFKRTDYTPDQVAPGLKFKQQSRILDSRWNSWPCKNSLKRRGRGCEAAPCLRTAMFTTEEGVTQRIAVVLNDTALNFKDYLSWLFCQNYPFSISDSAYKYLLNNR